MQIVNRYCEFCTMQCGIIRNHWSKIQCKCFFRRHSHTDQSFCLRCHEIDELRSTKLCGTNNIAFIFTIFIIKHDNNFACFQIFDCLLYGIKSVFHGLLSIYLRNCNLVNLDDCCISNLQFDDT